MIKTLSLITTIGSVVLSSIAPTFNNEPKIQKAENVELISWTLEEATRTNYYNELFNYNNNYYYLNISKYNTLKSNNYVSIRETTYTQTAISRNETLNTYALESEALYNNETYKTSILTITEITTYRGITNNEISYTLDITNNEINQYPELQANIYQRKTTDLISDYINLINFNQPNLPNTLYTELTNTTANNQLKYLIDATIDHSTEITSEIQLNNIWKTYIFTYAYWSEEQAYLTTTEDNATNDLFTIDKGEILGITPEIGDYEVIDIPNLMLTIITLPFAFISQAFNITLFPNTPYSINVGGLFIGILSIFIVIWLVKIIIKLLGGGK